MKIKIEKIERLAEGNRIKAFLTVCFDGKVTVKGIRLVEGCKGLFICMPMEQGKNERWYEKVRLAPKVKSELEKMAIQAFKGGYTFHLMVRGYSEDVTNIDEDNPKLALEIFRENGHKYMSLKNIYKEV